MNIDVNQDEIKVIKAKRLPGYELVILFTVMIGLFILAEILNQNDSRIAMMFAMYLFMLTSMFIGIRINEHRRFKSLRYKIEFIQNQQIAQQGDAPEPDSRRSCFPDATSRPGDL